MNYLLGANSELKVTKNVARTCKEKTLVGEIQSRAMKQSNIVWKIMQYGGRRGCAFAVEWRVTCKCKSLLWELREGEATVERAGCLRERGALRRTLGWEEEDPPYFISLWALQHTRSSNFNYLKVLHLFICSVSHSSTHSLYSLTYIACLHVVNKMKSVLVLLELNNVRIRYDKDR